MDKLCFNFFPLTKTRAKNEEPASQKAYRHDANVVKRAALANIH